MTRAQCPFVRRHILFGCRRPDPDELTDDQDGGHRDGQHDEYEPRRLAEDGCGRIYRAKHGRTTTDIGTCPQQ